MPAKTKKEIKTIYELKILNNEDETKKFLKQYTTKVLQAFFAQRLRDVDTPPESYEASMKVVKTMNKRGLYMLLNSTLEQSGETQFEIRDADLIEEASKTVSMTIKSSEVQKFKMDLVREFQQGTDKDAAISTFIRGKATLVAALLKDLKYRGRSQLQKFEKVKILIEAIQTNFDPEVLNKKIVSNPIGNLKDYKKDVFTKYFSALSLSKDDKNKYVKEETNIVPKLSDFKQHILKNLVYNNNVTFRDAVKEITEQLKAVNKDLEIFNANRKDPDTDEAEMDEILEKLKETQFLKHNLQKEKESLLIEKDAATKAITAAIKSKVKPDQQRMPEITKKNIKAARGITRDINITREMIHDFWRINDLSSLDYKETRMYYMALIKARKDYIKKGIKGSFKPSYTKLAEEHNIRIKTLKAQFGHAPEQFILKKDEELKRYNSEYDKIAVREYEQIKESIKLDSESTEEKTLGDFYSLALKDLREKALSIDVIDKNSARQFFEELYKTSTTKSKVGLFLSIKDFQGKYAPEEIRKMVKDPSTIDFTDEDQFENEKPAKELNAAEKSFRNKLIELLTLFGYNYKTKEGTGTSHNMSIKQMRVRILEAIKYEKSHGAPLSSLVSDLSKVDVKKIRDEVIKKWKTYFLGYGNNHISGPESRKLFFIMDTEKVNGPHDNIYKPEKPVTQLLDPNYKEQLKGKYRKLNLKDYQWLAKVLRISVPKMNVDPYSDAVISALYSTDKVDVQSQMVAASVVSFDDITRVFKRILQSGNITSGDIEIMNKRYNTPDPNQAHRMYIQEKLEFIFIDQELQQAMRIFQGELDKDNFKQFIIGISHTPGVFKFIDTPVTQFLNGQQPSMVINQYFDLINQQF